MKSNHDKNIESLVQRMMEDDSLEKPFIDFTSKVMSGVFSLEKKKSFSYKPVISRRNWIIIFAAIGGFITWLIFSGSFSNEPSPIFNFNFINADRIIKPFSGFQFSTITTNIILLAMVMIFIQILVLKNYLNKRFHK
jgi:hypothetical protein